MGIAGMLLLVAGSICMALLARQVGKSHFAGESTVTAFGAALGGFVTSGLVASTDTPGWTFDGLMLLPALIGALTCAGIVEAIGRSGGDPA